MSSCPHEERTKRERQFSVEAVCEYFPDFSAQEIKDLKRKMKNGRVFNPEEATTYLQYLDANNLYGWAMSQPLPVGGFQWMTENELGLPIEEIPPCFIETDLEYPIDLHDKFSELVPAPDKITPEGCKVEKLAPNLLPKNGYVCHIKVVRQTRCETCESSCRHKVRGESLVEALRRPKHSAQGKGYKRSRQKHV